MFKITNKDGEVITSGSVVVNFRGEKDTFIALERAESPGRSAKVLTSRGTFYAQVYDLKIEWVDE